VVEIARRTGAAPFGVDFSPHGVQQARAALRAAGLPDDGIAENSIETFASQHKDGFDIAVSFGLIEHFDDLQAIMAAHVAVVRPRGLIFVSSPNLSGLNLAWLRTASPAMAAWHRPIRPNVVADALRAEGATDVRFAYVGGPRLFAPAEKRRGMGLLAFVAFYVTQKVFNGLSEAMMRLAPGLGRRLGGRRLASQFVVIATVPAIGSRAPASSRST
jgi:SAM-dependent methyltransferase